MSERPLIDLRGQSPLPSMFNVRDTRSYPETFDMSTIQPTLDMAMGGYKDLHTYNRWRGATNAAPTNAIGGLQTWSLRIVSYGQAAGASPQILVPVNHCLCIWHLSYKITMDAAGAAAFNNKYFCMEVELSLADSGGVTHIVKPYRAEHRGDTNKRNYFDGMNDNGTFRKSFLHVIPAGGTLNLAGYTQNGADLFPVNTVLEYSLFGCIVPVGEPVPPM